MNVVNLIISFITSSMLLSEVLFFRYQHEVDRIKDAVRQRNAARRGHAPNIGKTHCIVEISFSMLAYAIDLM